MIHFLKPLLLTTFIISSSFNMVKDKLLNEKPSEITKIVFLGTGTPNPDPEHSGISVAIFVHKVPYLFDCGPGLVRKASAFNPKYGGKFEGFDVSSFKTLFITHLHSDHTLGYPDLILTPWVMGRTQPLEVYGPEGIKAMTSHILAAYDEDIKIRLNGLEHASEEGWKVNVHPIKSGIVYKDSNITVEAFAVEHGNWREAYGFLITTPDKKIAISGDTRPCENLVEKCKSVDVLIHEVYSAEKLKTRQAKWQIYHPHYHTSTYELGEIACKVNPKLLILYHQLYWGDNDAALVSQVKTKFNGNVVSAKDLDVF